MTGLPIPPRIIEFDDASPFLSAFATSYATSSASSQVSTDPTSLLPSEGKVEPIQEVEPVTSLKEEAEVENETATLSDATITTSSSDHDEEEVAAVADEGEGHVEEERPSDEVAAEAEADETSPTSSAASESGSTAPTHIDESDPITDDAPTTEDEPTVTADEETASSVGYTSYYVGDTCISDSLKHIANAYDEKCREVQILREMRDKRNKQAEDEKAALQRKVDELNAEVAALRDEMQGKDQLLAMSDKISTSLFGVLMNAKSTLDQAESLAPALRSFSQSYASSVSSTEDDDDNDTPATTDNEDDTITVSKPIPVSA